MEFDRRNQHGSTSEASREYTSAPGKATLAERLPPAGQPSVTDSTRNDETETRAHTRLVPVTRGALPSLQMLFRNRGAASEPEQVHAAAARGAATTATQLPHIEQIQRSFGKHDISGVQAHAGTDAAASAQEMGATAYATGNHVVLGAGANLHTVAHEAAHVIQQRAGVQLAGGIGVAGDTYEQHADAVADKVVRGESAEALLDRHAPGSMERGHHATQRSAVQREDAAAQASPRELRRAQVLAPLLAEWRAARLLDAPFRPADVAPFPDIAPPATGPIHATNTGGLAVAGAAPAVAGAVPARTPTPAPTPARPPLRVIPGGGGAPSPTPGPVPEPLPIPAPLLGLAVFLVVLLWPSETAPPWMDEISPITGGPYGSPEEYEWTRRLTEQQRAYLRHLVRMRDARPDAALDGEGDPYAVPAPAPAQRREPEQAEQCKASPVPRRGGHARHNAYATKVTGSPDDYYVRSGPGLAINYDGLQTGTTNVWEVKVGFGWFFNPGSAGPTAATLARWDAQKNLGIAVAASCGYQHLWAHPDRYVVQLLIARWGGIPPVVNLPE